jgi:3-hydroxyisobutyrate dehydrogenase
MPAYPESIGFIGLGTMGFPMASQLRKKLPDTPMFIYDVDVSATSRFLDAHPLTPTTACKNVSTVGLSAETIITILPADAHVRDVYSQILTESTTLFHKTFIDCSTIAPSTSLEILAQFPQQTRFFDAPVSGGPMGAEKTTLTFMLGGSEEELATLRPLLELMGSPTSIFACGDRGQGLAVKLANNYLSGLVSIATCEAYNFGMKAGLDPKLMQRIFSSSTAQNWVSDKCNPVPGLSPGTPPSNGYKPGFKVEMMAKDFGLALKAMEEVGASTELGTKGEEIYRTVGEDVRFRGMDSRVIFQAIGGGETGDRVGETIEFDT